MKSIIKIWALILCMMMPLIGLISPFNVNDAFAQGTGTGQGGLGTGMIISPIGLGMGGTGLGLYGMGGTGLGLLGMGGTGLGLLGMGGTGLGLLGTGSSLMGNALGLGLPVAGMGALGALPGSSLMGGGGLLAGGALGGTGGIGLPYLTMGGFGTSLGGGIPSMGQGFGLYPGAVPMMGQGFGLYPGAVPMMGQGFGMFPGVVPMMGQGFGMFPGISPMMPYMNIFGTGLPSGYGGAPYYNQFGSALGNQVRYASSNVLSGIPIFDTQLGYNVSPIYSYPYLNLFGGASIFPGSVMGSVYDNEDRTSPLPGVSVRVGNTIHVVTKNDGSYQFDILAGSYTIRFSKDDYANTERSVRVSGGLVRQMNPVYLIPNLNKDPVIEMIPPIEVIAGGIVEINPYDYASDPDGDAIDHSFEGDWVTDFPYVTTEDDIGTHTVTVVVEDARGGMTSQEVLIIVYPWYQMDLYVGFNLISYPFEDGDPNFTAFDLLRMLGDASQIDSIVSCPGNGEDCLSAWYEDGDPNGSDFTIEIGQGYKVYAYEDVETIVFNRYTQELQVLNLDAGVNLVGIASYPEGKTSYDLLMALGYDHVQAIYRFDPVSGTWSHTYWYNSFPTGDIFPILMGEGYKIQMKTDLVNFELSRQRYFAF